MADETGNADPSPRTDRRDSDAGCSFPTLGQVLRRDELTTKRAIARSWAVEGGLSGEMPKKGALQFAAAAAEGSTEISTLEG